MTRLNKKTAQGFMLLEALLALTIFSISITGIVLAVHATTDLTRTIEREKWVQKQFKNVLTEAVKGKQTQEEFEAGKNITLDEFGAQAIVEVTPSIIRSVNGTELENLYDVKVSIVWRENSEERLSTLETTHYYPLYQE